jgi:hypothetical protein
MKNAKRRQSAACDFVRLFFSAGLARGLLPMTVLTYTEIFGPS